jgi:hypothetical protein
MVLSGGGGDGNGGGDGDGDPDGWMDAMGAMVCWIDYLKNFVQGLDLIMHAAAAAALAA